MTALSPAAEKALEQAALELGDLRVLMTRTQLEVESRLNDLRAQTRGFVFVTYCSRRWGKTRKNALDAHSKAIQREGSIIRYCAPTKKHGRDFVIPAFDWVASRVPLRFRPRWYAQDNVWAWPNGSRCYLGSAETLGDADAQVGTECHRAFVDEAGKIRSDILRHLVRSVLLPQFLTTDGDLSITTTPALTPAHFLTELVTEARLKGRCAEYTIDDCDHVTQDARDRLIVELGGRESPEVQRELYLINDVDDTFALVPEFKRVKAEIVRETPQPEHRDWYVVADFGFSDLTAVGFAWFDFGRRVLVVEDEVCAHRQNGLVVGYDILKKEAAWGIRKPRRFADGDLQLLASVASSDPGPGVSFGPVRKLDADAALNTLRMRIGRKQIEINPRCTELIKHLHYGVWNERHTDWARVEGYGHFDFVAMMKYLVRAVDWDKNPDPPLPGDVRPSTHHIAPSAQRQHERTRRNARALLGR